MATMPTVVVTGDHPAITRFRARFGRAASAAERWPISVLEPAAGLSRPADLAVVAMDDLSRVAEVVRQTRSAGLAPHIVVLAAAISLDGLLSAMVAGADGWMLPSTSPTTWARTLEGVHRGESGFSRVDAMRLIRASRSVGARPIADPEITMTPRERDIHQSLAAGASTRDVARRLDITEGTVRWHAARAQKKLTATTRVGSGLSAVVEHRPITAHGDSRTPSARQQRTIPPPRTPAPPRDPRPALSKLSRAELRVALLVAEGMSNPEVATRLFVSRHTVESHLKQIFVKLEIRSRVELTRRVLAAAPAQTHSTAPRTG